MSLVSDASPLIFLNKIDQASLPRVLFHGPCLMPEIVHKEVLDSANEIERASLLFEFKHWRIKEIKLNRSPAGIGSMADWSVFQLAKTTQAKIVLADDKYLRGILSSAGLPALGTLGLLTLAVSKKVLTGKKVLSLGAALIEKHNLWIDALTYRMFVNKINSM